MSKGLTNLFDMMQTHANYTRPFPDQWFHDLTALCQDTALALKAIASTDPRLSPDLKADVNNYFHARSYNVAMVPDEVTRAATDFNSGWLHALTRMLDSDFISPIVIAPLARAAVENSSLLIYLNSFEPIDRCYWGMRALVEKMEYEEEEALIPNVYGSLTAAIDIYRAKNRGKKLKYPSNTALVKEQLKEFDGEEIYRVLSTYTHQHAWSAYKHFVFATHNPLSLELRALSILFDTLAATDLAARSFSGFRPERDIQPHLNELQRIAVGREDLRADWLDWMTENNVAPAP